MRERPDAVIQLWEENDVIVELAFDGDELRVATVRTNGRVSSIGLGKIKVDEFSAMNLSSFFYRLSKYLQEK